MISCTVDYVRQIICHIYSNVSVVIAAARSWRISMKAKSALTVPLWDYKWVLDGKLLRQYDRMSSRV